MDLVLVRVQSDGQTQRAEIDRTRTVIGRQTGCQMRIGSGEVSREHCELLVEEGTIVIRDLGSRNGTFVNAVKVNEKRLEAGDLLSIGPVVFLVQISGEPGSFDAALMHAAGIPSSEAPTAVTTPVASPSPSETDDPPTTAGGGLLDGIASDPGSSSVVEFDFDFDDEEEEQRSQPPL